MKKTIVVEDIREDLNRQVSDEELMAKYGLSEHGLHALLDRLLSALANGSLQIEVESDE